MLGETLAPLACRLGRGVDGDHTRTEMADEVGELGATDPADLNEVAWWLEADKVQVGDAHVDAQRALRCHDRRVAFKKSVAERELGDDLRRDGLRHRGAAGVIVATGAYKRVRARTTRTERPAAPSATAPKALAMPTTPASAPKSGAASPPSSCASM